MKRFILITLVFTLALCPSFASAEEEPITINFLTNINVDTEGYDVNDNPYINYLREATNLDIQIVSEATNYAQKLATVMASGDYPDYVMILDRDTLMMYAEQGMLLELNDYIDQTTYLKNGIQDITWNLVTLDDSIYAIPMERFDAMPYMSFVRRDWVEKLGVDISEVVTIEDWYNLLYRFTYEDPDGNGENDTYGLTAYTDGTDVRNSNMLNMFQDSFNAANYQVVDSEVIPNYITEEYKEWLKFMNRLYADGIMDPEYLTNTYTQVFEKTVSGKYGYFSAFWSIQEFLSYGGQRSDLIAVAAPAKADGSEAKYRYGSTARHYIALCSDTENADAVIKLMDWAYSDEGGVYVHAGIEGLDYDIVDDAIIMREGRDGGKNWAWRYLTLGIQKSDVDEKLRPILEESWGADAIEHWQFSNECGMYDYIAMYAPYFPELADYDLDSMVSSFRDNAIMGLIDIDAEWDTYVADWKKAGGDLWIELHSDWYNDEFVTAYPDLVAEVEAYAK